MAFVGVLSPRRCLMLSPIIDAMASGAGRKSSRLQGKSRRIKIAANAKAGASIQSSLKSKIWMRWRIIAAATAIVILAALAWYPAIHFGFVYDDHLQIESNRQLQSWSALVPALREPLWIQLGAEKASHYYRPLFLLVLFVQHGLFGLNPVLWHLFSIGLHTLVALTLFLFLFLQLGKLLPACIATCILVCSPLATEVVSWISACSESLYTLLFLCALCGLQLSNRSKTPTVALALRLSSACALALAVFTKETAIVAVVLAIAYDYLFLHRKPQFNLIPIYAPLILPLAAYLWIHPSLHREDSRSVVQVLSTILYLSCLAFQKLVWPVPVSEFYDLWLDQAHSSASLALHIGLLISTLGAILWVGLRSRFVAWALAVVVLPIAVVAAGSSLFRDYDLFHDRYLYLSAIGVAMLIAAVLARVEAQPRLRFAITAIVALVLGAEVWQSHLASQQFRDDAALFSHGVEVAPHNVVALQLVAETAIGRSDCPTAIEAYQRAQQLRPDMWKTTFFLGIGYSHCGKLIQASYAFNSAANAPDATIEEAALAWYEIGRMNLFQDDASGALIALRKAASLDPASHKIQILLTQLLSRLQRN
jgi:tetratricopeptide (TPR) repeat protein